MKHIYDSKVKEQKQHWLHWCISKSKWYIYDSTTQEANLSTHTQVKLRMIFSMNNKVKIKLMIELVRIWKTNVYVRLFIDLGFLSKEYIFLFPG